jgi:2,4'-dihydroxyacetophenone dioxygenase
MRTHGPCAGAHASNRTLPASPQTRGEWARVRKVCALSFKWRRRAVPSVGAMNDTTEFWRDLKPIQEVFRPGAGEDVYIADAPTEDERYYVPFTETVSSRPLWISPTQNRWCDILYAKGPGLVNRHYHPHQVFAYTISGKWGYLEHDWVATAGDFVYESPGEGHTLVAYDHPDPMKVHFNVTGPLIWIDEDGQPVGQFDVFDYIKLCEEHYEKVGIGAEYVAKLYR